MIPWTLGCWAGNRRDGSYSLYERNKTALRGYLLQIVLCQMNALMSQFIEFATVRSNIPMTSMSIDPVNIEANTSSGSVPDPVKVKSIPPLTPPSARLKCPSKNFNVCLVV